MVLLLQLWTNAVFVDMFNAHSKESSPVMTNGMCAGGKTSFLRALWGYGINECGVMQSVIPDATRSSLDSAEGHEQNQHARSQEQVSMAQQPVQTHHSPG